MRRVKFAVALDMYASFLGGAIFGAFIQMHRIVTVLETLFWLGILLGTGVVVVALFFLQYRALKVEIVDGYEEAVQDA